MEKANKSIFEDEIRKSQMKQGKWDPLRDDVHIRVDKQGGREDFHPVIQANTSTALIHALAILIVLAAQLMEVSVDSIYARVATVLFAQEGDGDA